MVDKYTRGSGWQNPYQEFNTIAISPSTIKYNRTYCSVMLPSNLFLSNRSSEISTIQFDAADGQGFRTIQYNTPISLNYTDTGWKHWVFKIILTNEQQLLSHAKVYFSNISNAAGSGGAARGIVDRRETITANEAFNVFRGIADIVISYRNANDQVLRRPLIVAEGFDPGWITNPEEVEGENTFIGFVQGVINSNSFALRNLITDNPSQYDLVYVNWRNGTDWLQRNALALEAVIRWVNANKQPLAGVMQPNVVLGSSMGGVIARMALGRMDRGGGLNGAGGFAAHQTNLYVSLDAPHQGANVPLGYQAAARHATRMYVSIGTIAASVEIIQLLSNGPSPLLNLLLSDQPASRQMLNNRINLFYNPANATNQQFLQELRTQWAYPVNIRNIAISNGSECAIDQEFAAGSSLLYHYRSTKTRFIGDLIFMVAGAGLAYVGAPPLITIPLILPGSNKFELTLDIKSIANGGGNAVYYGNIKLTKKVLWLLPVSVNIANKTYNAPTGILPFDTYPGGFYTLTLGNQPSSVSQDWMFSYNNSFYIQRRFSYIPTTSALDIGQGNTALTNANYLARYIGATPPAAPFNTPFANFATAFNQNGIQLIFDNNNLRRLNNEPHERLFIRSANFLANEMNGINNIRTNCEAFCANGAITGNSLVCNAQTFTAPFGIGVIYNWSISDPTIAAITPNGNTVLVTRINGANGAATLTANITGACGTTSLSLPLTIGSINSLTGTYSTNTTTKPIQTVNFVPSTYIYAQYTWPGISNITATLGSGSAIGTGFNASGSVFTFTLGVGQSISVNFNGTSACGPVNANRVFAQSSYGFRVAVSPNPSNSNLNVLFTNENDEATSNKTIGQELKIIGTFKSNGKTIFTLFEVNTNLQVRQWIQNDTKSKSNNLNIAGLRKGIYVLQVDRNNQTATTKILVE